MIVSVVLAAASVLVGVGPADSAFAATKKLKATPVPTIRGAAVVGSTLTANPGTWKPAPVQLSFRWYVDGKKVAGAEASTWLVPANALGSTVKVKVTGKRSGYKAVTRTSKATVAITTLDLGTDTLVPGKQMENDQFIRSTNGRYRLVMQKDGNFVLYDNTSGKALWAAGTNGSNRRLAMQADGNLVVYEGSVARWSSNTADFPGANLVVQNDGNVVIYRKGIALWTQGSGYMGFRLGSGITLGADAFIRSPNHRYWLIMQGDGNLVLYDHGNGDKALWAAGTNGPNRWAVMQGDGNFVVYEGSTARWSSGTAGKSGARLEVQNDANLVIYQGSTAVWDRNKAAVPDAKARAQSWVDAGVTYSQSAYYSNQYGRYRTDCSGYVSMIWGLGSSYTTSTLPGVSHPIGKDDLRTGDVLLDNTGSDAHVVMFDSWATADHTYYWAYEQTPPKAVFHKIPYPYWSGYGPYSPYRKN